ncbi:MAG: hypothetical protein H6839_13855 [Planctomycetes bacterium]|nr:hypothetical protein [Planctomycetota bacterium]
MKFKRTIAFLFALLAGLPAIALATAGCQTAPVDNTNKANKEPAPKENTAPANNAAANSDPEPTPEPEVDPDVVKGQDGKEVIFVLGVDGMD